MHAFYEGGVGVRKCSGMFLPLVGSCIARWRWKCLVRSRKLIKVLSFSGQVINMLCFPFGANSVNGIP